MTDFTKRSFPTLARVWFDFHEIFEGDITRTYAAEGPNETGSSGSHKKK